MDRSMQVLNRPASAPRVREVDSFRPFFWLRLGWDDLREHAFASVAYGLFFALSGYFMLHYAADKPHVVIVAVSGFVLVGPVLAAGLYEISRRSAARKPAGLVESLQGIRQNLDTLIPMGLLLAMILLGWERTSAWVFTIAYPGEISSIGDFLRTMLFSSDHLRFTIAYMATGSVFAMLVFCTSVITVPMLMDRNTDVLSAVQTSLKTVCRNPKPMLLWAALIVLIILVGFATLMIGLILLIPILGHATWHAYRDIVD